MSRSRSNSGGTNGDKDSGTKSGKDSGKDDDKGSGTHGDPTAVVDRALRAALYADDDTALDTGASLLAADPATDVELARRGAEFVAQAWRRGWQPADVVRIVRRELTTPMCASPRP